MESVIKQVKKMAVKDGVTKGLSFRNRRGAKYKFDNDIEYKMLVEPEEPAPFLNIPYKVPGILTERKVEFGVGNMVQEETEQTDKEQAMLAAENSGLNFSSLPTKVMRGEGIKILSNEEEEAINKYVQEEIMMKVEPDREEEMQQDAVKTAKRGEPRRLARVGITNRQYADYELYLTVKKDELMLVTMGNKPDKEDKDEEVFATIAHYIVAHYAEEEGIKNRKKYKPKSGQYQLEARIKWFGKQGETVVTKKLNQFNKYKVFKPQHQMICQRRRRKHYHPSYS